MAFYHWAMPSANQVAVNGRWLVTIRAERWGSTERSFPAGRNPKPSPPQAKRVVRMRGARSVSTCYRPGAKPLGQIKQAAPSWRTKRVVPSLVPPLPNFHGHIGKVDRIVCERVPLAEWSEHETSCQPGCAAPLDPSSVAPVV